MGNEIRDIDQVTPKIHHSENNSISSKNDILDSNTNSTSDVNKICPKAVKESRKLQQIILIQSYFRGFINRKKFSGDLELLINILILDSTVNVIKDENLKRKLLLGNKGECLSNKLISNKILIPYQNTNYYKINIKKYKLSKFLIQTPLTYIDKFKDSNMYIGTWTLDKRFQGYGIFYAYGNKYEGFWDHGKLKGQCRYFLSNGDYFIGTFKDGKANGYGKYFYKDGSKYEGEWKDDQPNGKGKEISDDLCFKGIFSSGVKVSGFFKWDDGSFYEGQIENNNFHGKGKFHWKEGSEYIGEWKYGKMNGKGVMNYLDGTKYEGYFVDGKRGGIGKYIWNDKKYYKGNWENGEQNGKGHYFNEGRETTGFWKNGELRDNFIKKIDVTKKVHRIFKYSNSFSKLPRQKNIFKNSKYDMLKINTGKLRRYDSSHSKSRNEKISKIKKISNINKMSKFIISNKVKSNKNSRNVSLKTENEIQSITDTKLTYFSSPNSRQISIANISGKDSKNKKKKKKTYITNDIKKKTKDFTSFRIYKNPFK